IGQHREPCRRLGERLRCSVPGPGARAEETGGATSCYRYSARGQALSTTRHHCSSRSALSVHPCCGSRRRPPASATCPRCGTVECVEPVATGQPDQPVLSKRAPPRRGNLARPAGQWASVQTPSAPTHAATPGARTHPWWAPPSGRRRDLPILTCAVRMRPWLTHLIV